MLRIGHHYPTRLRHGLHSFGRRAALHDSIRGREGLFEKVVEFNGRLEMLQRRHRNLGVNVVTALSSLNSEQADRLLEYVHEHLAFDDYGALIVRGDTLDPAARRLDPEVFGRFQKVCAERSKAHAGRSGSTMWFYSALNQLAAQLVAEVAADDRFVAPCLAGRVMVVMDDEGSVEPCEILRDFVAEETIQLRSSRLGTMRELDYDIRRVLGTTHARQVVDTIVSNKCRCTYECAMAANVLYTPRLLLLTLVRAALGGG